MKDKREQAEELKREANKLLAEYYEEKRRNQIKAREDFENETEINVYTSDDYCGLMAGRYSFYYGYEVTVCPVKSHRKNCEDYGCEKREWAFQAEIDDKVVLTLPTSKLHPEEGEEPFWYLVAGIGHFLKLAEYKR